LVVIVISPLSSGEEMLHRSIMIIWERETILQAAILEATGAGVNDTDQSFARAAGRTVEDVGATSHGLSIRC
jgi:hypothetical protein